jgi:hypothetical protein
MDFNATLRGWADMLNRVRSVAPSAFLAGGAVRDLDNGRPVKDLDVFFNEETVGDWDFGKVLGGRYVYKNGVADCSYIDAASEICSTSTFSDVQGGPDLNLINTVPGIDTMKMLERMDFGICLIGFNGEQVIRTSKYDHDQRGQMFTLTRADTIEGTVRSLKRYDRLVQKYEDWPLVIPAHLREVGYEAMRRHMSDKVIIAEFAQSLCQAPNGAGHTAADRPGAECRSSGQCQVC